MVSALDSRSNGPGSSPGRGLSDVAIVALPLESGFLVCVFLIKYVERWLVADAGGSYRPALYPLRLLASA